jgi:hypothetical protein
MNTRSLVSTGEELPKGSAVFHRTLEAGPNSAGKAPNGDAGRSARESRTIPRRSPGIQK